MVALFVWSTMVLVCLMIERQQCSIRRLAVLPISPKSEKHLADGLIELLVQLLCARSRVIGLNGTF